MHMNIILLSIVLFLQKCFLINIFVYYIQLLPACKHVIFIVIIQNNMDIQKKKI